MKRRRRNTVPIVIVIVFLLVSLIGSTFAAAPAAPPSPEAVTLPPEPQIAQTPPPAPTTLGRYPATSEASVVGSCVSGIDPNTVPGPIAHAFCVCTLNAYEQLYPTYGAFQQAIAAGAITDAQRTQISTRCTQALVGG